MLEYERYKILYPQSKISNEEFSTFCSNIAIEVLSIIASEYDFNKLYELDNNIALVIASQVYFVEQTGEYFDGITSQSATNTSVSISAGYKLGDYMWNKSTKDYLTSRYGVYVYH